MINLVISWLHFCGFIRLVICRVQFRVTNRWPVKVTSYLSDYIMNACYILNTRLWFSVNILFSKVAIGFLFTFYWCDVFVFSTSLKFLQTLKQKRHFFSYKDNYFMFLFFLKFYIDESRITWKRTLWKHRNVKGKTFSSQNIPNFKEKIFF